MPQAIVDTSTAEDAVSVRPISASLGVNPDWHQSAPAPLIVPAYQGAPQITQMALMFTLWAGVEQFLYDDCGVAALDNCKEEKRQLGILRESETSILCLLCLLNNEPYSAGGLIDAMIGQHATADQRGNARKRLINRTLPVIAGRYELLQYQESLQGNQKEYAITRSVRLAQFAEQHLATGVQQIITGDFTCPSDADGGDQ